MRLARSASSGVLTLKNGSIGSIRPVGDGNAVARRPHLDLAQIFLNQRLAQIGAQRQRPQADHRMAPLRPNARRRAARRRPSARRAWCSFSTRSSGRNGQSPGTLTIHSTPLSCAAEPVEPGQNAGERAGMVRHVVGHHDAAGVGEAFGVAVGVDDDVGALRRQTSPARGRGSMRRRSRCAPCRRRPCGAPGRRRAPGRGSGEWGSSCLSTFPGRRSGIPVSKKAGSRICGAPLTRCTASGT